VKISRDRIIELIGQLDEVITDLKKSYPLADKEEVLKLLCEVYEEGNRKYSIEQAVKVSHEKNSKKKKGQILNEWTEIPV